VLKLDKSVVSRRVTAAMEASVFRNLEKLPWRPFSMSTIAPQLPATREASSSEIVSNRDVGR
jgi:hypothetical protein